jgi:AcrR family transcriptional regulator
MTEIKHPGTKPKTRVKKSDWLKLALEVLEEGGIQAVRVEIMAARLNVAKSGFYYHFRDRDDLYEKMLDHWLTMDGAPLVRERMAEAVSPQDRLRIVADVVDKAGLSRFDVAVRQWARQDQKVRRVWRAEMKKRIAHIRGFFAELGFEGDDLEMRTRTFVAYQTSERDLFDDLSVKDREKMRSLQIALLTQRG